MTRQLKIKLNNGYEESSTQGSILKKYLYCTKKYAKDLQIQKSYEDSLCTLTAKALTPLSLCEHEAYQDHIKLLDPRINSVS